MMIDATIVWALQHSAGARKDAQAIARSRGGLSTEIHALARNLTGGSLGPIGLVEIAIGEPWSDICCSRARNLTGGSPGPLNSGG